MSDVRYITDLGSCKIIETYVFYDEPVLFSCKNESGKLYLGVFSDKTQNDETWLYVRVDINRLKQIRTGEIDLYTALTEPEDEFLFMEVIPYSDEAECIMKIVRPNVIPKDILPIPGNRLDLDSDTFPILDNLDLEAIPLSKIKAVAEQSWWRKTSERRLAEDHSLTEAQIEELRVTSEYQKVVGSLMLGQRSPQDFEKWVKSHYGKPEVFSRRMGFDVESIPSMIKRVRQAHSDIASGKAKLPKVVVDPSLKKGNVKIEMKLRFCKSEIDYWANRYTECQRPSGCEREKQVIGLRDDIQQQGYLTRSELHKVAYWKTRNIFGRADLTLQNSDNLIKEITTQAFTSTDDWEKLISLTRLEGIREPIASAILHLYDQGQYPILDIHALWSVGLEWETRTSYPFWPDYVQFCRDIASRNNISMRDLDRALWRFSFDHRKQERAG